MIKPMEEEMADRKISTVLWFAKGGEDAAKFYTRLIPNSRILGTYTPPMGDDMGQPSGEPLVIDFDLGGVPYQILNAGPHFKQTEAVSIMVQTEDQTETDHLWNALIADGGEESMCGWLKDKFGLSWQVNPRILGEMLSDPDSERANRAMKAMLKMVKFDIAELKRAYSG